jgi:hypothetical protein
MKSRVIVSLGPSIENPKSALQVSASLSGVNPLNGPPRLMRRGQHNEVVNTASDRIANATLGVLNNSRASTALNRQYLWLGVAIGAPGENIRDSSDPRLERHGRSGVY